MESADAAVLARLKRFKGPRGLVHYDGALQDAKLLYFAAEGPHRLLQHHYAFNFFADPNMQSFYKRFIRDYMRYQDEIQCAGHELVALIRQDARELADAQRRARVGEGFDANHNASAPAPYYALHVRRGDFQFRDVKISAARILANLGGNALIPRGALVYLSTDDPEGVCRGCTYKKKPCSAYPEGSRDSVPGCMDDPSWRAFSEEAGWEVRFLGDYLKRGALKATNPNFHGMVETVVCSRADVFAGTWWSTFTGYIHRLRGYHGLGEATYYHTPGRLDAARQPESMGHGFSREWRYGWTDDQGALI